MPFEYAYYHIECIHATDVDPPKTQFANSIAKLNSTYYKSDPSKIVRLQFCCSPASNVIHQTARILDSEGSIDIISEISDFKG
jgi:hypothetical protein